MTASPIVWHLNAALKNQLTCISQCFLHARILKHKGFLQLADAEYKESLDTMKHADMLVERILSLGGIPNMQDLGDMAIGETLNDILAHDLALKEAVARQARAAIAACREAADQPSEQLLAKILANIEEHIVFLRAELDQLCAA